MEEGRFVEIGPPDQVIGNPREELTRQFLARFLRGDGRPTTTKVGRSRRDRGNPERSTGVGGLHGRAAVPAVTE